MESETKSDAVGEILSVQDFAALMGIGLRTAYKLVEQGEVPSFRLGERLVRIRRSDVESYIERRLTRA